MSLRLPEHPSIQRRAGPVVLCILDGVGVGEGGEDDAVATARTPNLDRLRATCPSRTLRAHGTAVGMPTEADLGNSEVGHNAMGAGRVFDQGAKRVDLALGSGAAFQTPLWRELVAAPTLHLLGLVSDGNVHSHVAHLHALLDRAVADGVKRLRLHVLTDGRDVAPRSALTWLEPLEAKLADLREAGIDAWIGSGGGRMRITMDRYEADWDMVARGWRCHVHGEGRPFGSAGEAVRRMYAERAEADDQSLDAFVIVDDQGAPRGRIANGDAVFLFNFRGDRAIEISRAFEAVDFDAFDRGPAPKVLFAGMMQYDGDLQVPARFLVPPPAIDRTVGQYLVANGRRSFAISETQKFGHVTFFYNGNRSGRIDPALETWLEVPSDKVPFWQRPWMKAAEVTDAAVEAILSGRYDHVRLNYPNGDMVGHTGDLEATRIAVEVVDRQLARLEAAVREVGGLLLITADHGNADEMWMRGKGGAPARDAEGRPLARTAHTTHPVPFVVVDPLGRLGLAEGPELADAGIASLGATVLACCGLGTPAEYLPALVAAR